MAGQAYFEELLEAGVRIYAYQPGLLHAKTITVDDSIAFMGSSNFDIRSFSLNFEINLLPYVRDATRSVLERQMEYLQDCHPVTLSDWQDRGSFKCVSQDVAKLFSPLL